MYSARDEQSRHTQAPITKRRLQVTATNGTQRTMQYEDAQANATHRNDIALLKDTSHACPPQSRYLAQPSHTLATLNDQEPPDGRQKHSRPGLYLTWRRLPAAATMGMQRNNQHGDRRKRAQITHCRDVRSLKDAYQACFREVKTQCPERPRLATVSDKEASTRAQRRWFQALTKP